MLLIILLPMWVGVMLMALWYYLKEIYENNGVCPHCNTPLILYNSISSHQRRYYCECCGYEIWITQRKIDKKLPKKHITK